MKLITMVSVITASAIAFASSAIAGASVTATYKTSADKLWQAVDFHQPSENIMPPIASSKLEGKGLGARKVNTLQGGGEVHLQLVHFDPEARAFNYVIQSSPLPVKNYVGEVRVSDAGDGRAKLIWRGVYEPNGVGQAKADEILQGFYEAIAGKIGEKFPRE